MQICINLDQPHPIDVESIQSNLYLASIVLQLTVDSKLSQKLSKISLLVPYLAQNPTIKTKLKVLAIHQNPLKQYKVVAVGGTFDYLHIGHQILLLYTALSASQTIHIGVTGDTLLANKKIKELIQILPLRQKYVQDFVKSVNGIAKLVIFELNDPFGPTVTLQEIECLVASPETRSSVKKINLIRKERGLSQLELVQCPLISPDEQIQRKLSTTAIKIQLSQRNQLTSDELRQYKKWFYKLVDMFQQFKEQPGQIMGLAQLWWDYVFLSYSQRWRYYHTNRHIYHILKRWNSQQFQKERLNHHPRDRLIVQIVLFFHDVVYIPGSVDNQRESAEICERFIKQCLGKEHQATFIIKQAKRLILETEKHAKPASRLSQIVYDLDMGVLNDPVLYKSYAEGIRKEYKPLLKQQYPKKRSEFLTNTLKQGLHFSYAATSVQQNMRWELQWLQKTDL